MNSSNVAKVLRQQAGQVRRLKKEARRQQAERVAELQRKIMDRRFKDNPDQNTNISDHDMAVMVHVILELLEQDRAPAPPPRPPRPPRLPRPPRPPLCLMVWNNA